MPDTVPQRRAEDQVNVRAVAWASAAIVAAIVIAAGLAYFIFRKNMGPQGYSGPNAALDMQIAGPALESTPASDRVAFEADKQKLINSWQWVDRTGGIARIPVEQAMRVLAGQGAPAGKETQP